MDLKLTFLNGARSGQELTLSPAGASARGTPPWIYNKESFELSLIGPLGLTDLELYLYDYCEPCHHVKPLGSNLAVYSWQPSRSASSRDKALFHNYFGMAEIRITGLSTSGAPFETLFEPVEVVVDERDASKIMHMFDYLARQSPESLYQAFSATQLKAGHRTVYERPSLTLERLEASLSLVATVFPSLVNQPISRLVPESQLVSTTGYEHLDDTSIGWLMENMSVLSPAETPEDSHLLYQDQFYRADHLVVPVLLESTDLYENQIIHGFVALLLTHAEELMRQYSRGGHASRGLARPEQVADGYVSFFSQMSQFRERILGRHVGRCEMIVHRLHQLERELRERLPVKQVRRERPYFTQKVQTRPAYREIFADIIRWHECGQIDWSAFDNLFSIENLPSLFEHYCFFRTAETVTCLLSDSVTEGVTVTDFTLGDGTMVSILKEPHYWMPGHDQARTDGIVNSEGYTPSKGERRVGNLNVRSRTSGRSRRSPDIVIEVQRPDGTSPILFVMDAKYTHPWYVFTRDLPSLTMKYVHGIHSLGSRQAPVVSLTLLHPLQESIGLRSHHGRDFDIFSENPVQPSLQCLGVNVVAQPKPNDDDLHRLIKRLFDVNGVSLSSSNVQVKKKPVHVTIA